jgi:glutamate synthase domain-containing protein 3
MGIVEIDAINMATKDLNEHIRDLMYAGSDKVLIKNVCGQRYIGTRLYSHERRRLDIEIFGTAGNDLGAFLCGHRIIVHGNAQDGVGNTMDDGEIVIKGRAGDVLGMSMRGGKIFVRDNVGYRTGLHMKEYLDKRPIVVIGGTSQDFLGEYMAGGIIILLGLGGKTHKANFIGTGMHGGVIYLSGNLTREQLGKEVEVSELDNSDKELLDKYVSQFLDYFPEIKLERDQILNKDFIKLVPKSSRPYEKLYAY